MINQQQIDHFRTFGFVLLPGFLGPERTQALRAEVDRAIRDAYAATYDERVVDGISGHYLPMASRLTPMSASLVCDDPVLIGRRGSAIGCPGTAVVARGRALLRRSGLARRRRHRGNRGQVRHLLRRARCRQRRPALRALLAIRGRAAQPAGVPAGPLRPVPRGRRGQPPRGRHRFRPPHLPLVVSGGGTAWPGRSSTWPSPQTKRPGTRRCDGWTVPSSRLCAALTGSGTRPGVTGWRTRPATAVGPSSQTAYAAPACSTGPARTSAGNP